MIRVLMAVGWVLFGSPVAQAQSAVFFLEPLGSTGCTQPGALAMGQQVRLTASRLTPGESVEFTFNCCSSTQAATEFPIVFADSDGFVDTVVTVPFVQDGSTTFPALGLFQMRTQHPGGSFAQQMVGISPPGEAASKDTDEDGVPDFCDNCPNEFNPSQNDIDQDGLGDDLTAGETSCDACPYDQTNDSDGDGICEGMVGQCTFDPDNDIDQDGVCGNVDNCPTAHNPSQQDDDQNGIGDACQNGIPSCSDGVDNDLDGFIDFPKDPGCSDAKDAKETSKAIECDDGVDNDADGLVDFSVNGSGDPGCGKYPSLATRENPQCDDGLDNDGDGLVDADGDFVGEPDPECGGFGFGNDEAVPEPSLGFGLFAGTLGIYALVRPRSRQRVATRLL